MASAEYDEFMRDVVADLPFLSPLLEEHLVDQEGELLPHLLMHDVWQWVIDHHDDDRQRVVRVLTRLDRVLTSPDPDVREVVSVSFLEHWPRHDEPGAVVREWLPLRLAADLAEMERPRPGLLQRQRRRRTPRGRV